MATALEAVSAEVPARERQRRHTVVLACIVALSLALYASGIGRADLHNVCDRSASDNTRQQQPGPV